MELNPIVKTSLIKIDFIKRYEALSNQYNAERTPADERLLHIDGSEVMEMIQNLGYIPKFNSREKFYKIEEEQNGKYAFGFHIILRGGSTEFVWVVKEGKEVLLGSPWGVYAKRIIDPSYRIKLPIFGTYEDLEEILSIAFGMYEDFKATLLMMNT